VDLWFFRVKQLAGSVSREKREPQAGPASRLSNSASKAVDASGDDVSVSEPNTKMPVKGEGIEGLPGSKSVARAEADARNRGGPDSSCRTNYESQAGRAAQRQEARLTLRESDWPILSRGKAQAPRQEKGPTR